VGVIDALGRGVSGLTIGQRVISLAGFTGTWAEQMVIPADRALPVPDVLSDQVAAQILVNPVTAWVLLTVELTLSRGDWVLQTAAGSTLGRLIIQLARHRGLRTVNVVRRRDQVQELLDLGADAVVATDEESLIDRVRALTGGQGVRGAIDSVSGPGAAAVAACLSLGGTMITFGGLGGTTVGPIEVADLVFKGATIRGFWLTDWFRRTSSETVARTIGEVMTLLATRVLEPPVAAEYDLADFRVALAHAEQPGRHGKVLLRG
jgi:NADPH2:quinone reductase